MTIKLVEKEPRGYDCPYANLADLLLRQNRYDEALQAATQAANRNPRSARNFCLGGRVLLKLGRAEDAQKWLEQAVALDSNYPDALYALGQLYMRAGQKEKAAETLNRFREVKANAPKKRR
jgi:tetratricopeptide (TPR) repeat protein